MIRDWRWTVPLFLVIVVVHVMSAIKQPGDSRWTLHTSLSLLTEGNADLVEYGLRLPEHENYTLVWVDGVPYNHFPLGPALVALPAVALIDGGMRLIFGRSYRTELLAGHHSDVQEAIASLIAAAAALVLWSLGRQLGLTRPRTLMLVVLFAFGTSVWSAASRALLPHGPSLLMLGLTLLFLLRAAERPRLLWAAGAALALAYLMRPTNAVAVVGLTAWTIVRFRRAALPLVAGGAIVGVLFAWHNLAVYGALLPPYFQPGRLALTGTFPEALAGNLVSPARGLFVFSPVLLFAVAGWRRWQRDPEHRALINVLAGIVVVHWLVISSFPHWWAGWSFGPRFFTDMLLFLAVLLVPVVRDLEPRTRRGAVFTAALVYGVVIHWAGTNLIGPMEWNGRPNDIDHHHERVWDWGDPQFLRWRAYVED